MKTKEIKIVVSERQLEDLQFFLYFTSMQHPMKTHKSNAWKLYKAIEKQTSSQSS